MELAAMEGEPETLQSLFEKIRSDQDVEDFLVKFMGLLKILKTKLYENTKYQKKIYPYKEFGLHTEQQKIWLKENIRHILPDTDLQSMKIKLSDNTEFINPLPEFDSIRKHVDRFTSPSAQKYSPIKEGESQGVEDVAWVQISPEAINSLFANHSLIIKKTLEKLLENGDVKIDKQHIRNTVLQI
jgi:hypothetical protein